MIQFQFTFILTALSAIQSYSFIYSDNATNITCSVSGNGFFYTVYFQPINIDDDYIMQTNTFDLGWENTSFCSRGREEKLLWLRCGVLQRSDGADLAADEFLIRIIHEPSQRVLFTKTIDFHYYTCYGNHDVHHLKIVDVSSTSITISFKLNRYDILHFFPTRFLYVYRNKKLIRKEEISDQYCYMSPCNINVNKLAPCVFYTLDVVRKSARFGDKHAYINVTTECPDVIREVSKSEKVNLLQISVIIIGSLLLAVIGMLLFYLLRRCTCIKVIKPVFHSHSLAEEERNNEPVYETIDDLQKPSVFESSRQSEMSADVYSHRRLFTYKERGYITADEIPTKVAMSKQTQLHDTSEEETIFSDEIQMENRSEMLPFLFSTHQIQQPT